MKRIFVLPGLLLLAACSTVGQAGRVGGGYTMNEYQIMRLSNTKVTGLAQTTTNRAEIVEYAKSVNVVVSNDEDVSSVLESRVGYVKPGHSPESSNRDKVPVFNNQYQIACQAFENLYKIYTNGLTGLDINTDVKSAYMIAGGDADAYTWDANLGDEEKTEIVSFISARAEGLLDRFFERDTNNTDAWVLEGKAQDLSDVKLMSPSGSDVLTFLLDEHGEIIGIQDGTGQYSRLGRNSARFQKMDTTKEYTDVTTIGLQTYGDANNLTYADFGVKSIDEVRKFDGTAADKEKATIYGVFAGGYDLKNINSDVVRNYGKAIDFEGTAVGVVTGTDNSQIIIAGGATLNVQGGVEVLDAKFDEGSVLVDGETKWYHMHIENDGSHSAIQFTKGDGVTEKYQLTNSNPTDNYNVNIDYYGDYNNPTEFVGTATYADPNGVSMDSVFGGTVNKSTTQ